MIPYNKTNPQDHTCSISEDGAWYVSCLIDAIKDTSNVIPFDLDTWSIQLSRDPWNLQTMYDFVTHVRQMNEADLSYPVILSEDGVILDGWHRLAKAITTGQRYIKAVRFNKNPPYSAFTLKG